VYASCLGCLGNFGHFVHDWLSFASLVPAEIRASMIALFGKDGSCKSVAEAVGLMDMAGMLSLKDGEYIFAHEVVAWEPVRSDVQEAVPLVALRRLFVERVGLDKTPPSCYAVLQRKASRRINNLEEVVAQWAREYPGRVWRWSYGSSSIRNESLLWNDARMFMGAQGAGAVCVVFMQPRAVWVEIMSMEPRGHEVRITRAVGVCHIAYGKPDFPVEGDAGDHDFTPIEAARIIDSAMFCLREPLISRAPEPSPASAPTPKPSPGACRERILRPRSGEEPP
jgi:hypothetical protein